MRSWSLRNMALAMLVLASLPLSARTVFNHVNQGCLSAFDYPVVERRVANYLACTTSAIDHYAAQRMQLVDQLRQLEAEAPRRRAHYEANCASLGEAENFRQEMIRAFARLRDQVAEAPVLVNMVQRQRVEDVRGAWQARRVVGNLDAYQQTVANTNRQEGYRHYQLLVSPERANANIRAMEAMRPRQCGPQGGPVPFAGAALHPQATANQWYVWLKAGEYTCCRSPDGRQPQPARWDWGSRIPADAKVIGGPFADERAARAWMCGHQVNIAQAHIHNWAIVNGTLVSNLPCANLANTRYK